MQTPLSAQSQTRQWTQNKTCEVSSQQRKTLFYHQGGQTLEHAATQVIKSPEFLEISLGTVLGSWL